MTFITHGFRVSAVSEVRERVWDFRINFALYVKKIFISWVCWCFWCTACNCQIIFRCASIHGRAGFILYERQRALYGIKCVLRIFWQTWMHILTNIKKSTLCKHVPCNTPTHSTNEDLLNIKRKVDPEVSYPLSYLRYRWNPEASMFVKKS
jgi:hypothetical protein